MANDEGWVFINSSTGNFSTGRPSLFSPFVNYSYVYHFFTNNVRGSLLKIERRRLFTNEQLITYYSQGYRHLRTLPSEMIGNTVLSVIEYNRSTCNIIVMKDNKQIGSTVEGYLDNGSAIAIDPIKLLNKILAIGQM